MVKPGILVIADDASLRATLAKWLLRAGYTVELAESPRRAREVITKPGICLAILAPQALGALGIELARDLGRDVGHLMVIDDPIVDAGATPESSIEADARISLPLNEPDVLTKVSSVLALASAPVPQTQPAPQLLRFEGYTLDAGARICVDSSGQEMTLTRAEFSLLLIFVQQPGRVLSRDELTRVVAGRGAEPDDRSIDVLISRLRRKIEPEPKAPKLIVTVPGEGYRFAARPQAVVATDRPSELPGESAPQKTESLANSATGMPDRPQSDRRGLALGAGLAAVLVIAAIGWKQWSNPAAGPRLAEATPPATSSEVRAPSTPPQPVVSEAERRAAVFKRMVLAMQNERFGWRTIERLAIESGVEASEAHEILAEHPGEVVLGKSREGKLIARLSER
jgi:two-component system OmpR family response regulator